MHLEVLHPICIVHGSESICLLMILIQGWCASFKRKVEYCMKTSWIGDFRLLSATGTIFLVANYLWPPLEYTIAIVLVTDCHRAVTVIIFTFWRFLKCPRKPFCPNLDEARWTRDRHQPPLIQLPMILGFRQPDRQQTWQPPVLPAAERQQSVAAWPKSSEAGRCHGAR